MKKMFAAVAVLFLLAGCCSHPELKSSLKKAAAINAGHMNDDKLPPEARAIGQDNYDYNHAALKLLGEKLPTDTAERKAERDAKKPKAGGDK